MSINDVKITPYQFVISNCAKLMQQKAFAQMVVRDNGLVSNRALKKKIFAFAAANESLTAFDVSIGIAAGFMKRKEDVVADLVSEQNKLPKEIDEDSFFWPELSQY